MYTSTATQLLDCSTDTNERSFCGKLMSWRDIESNDAPSVEDTEQIMESLVREWRPPDSGEELRAWATTMFDIDDDADFGHVEEKGKVISEMLAKIERTVQHHCTPAGSNWSEAVELQYREALDAAIRQCFLINTYMNHDIALRVNGSLPMHMRPATGAEQPKKTPFQRTLLYILGRLAFCGYRRVGEMCYKERKTPAPHFIPSHCYVEECSIMDFVQRSCHKAHTPEEWDDLMASKCSIADDVVKQLQRGHDTEFPELNPDRYLLSFNNGLYNIEQNMFYAWNERADWGRQASVELDRRNAFRVRAHLDLTLAIPQAPSRIEVAMNYYDATFPVEHMSNPNATPTPEIDSIFTNQQLTEETREQFYMMLGRLLYPVGEKENWQKQLIMLGLAGVGKSVICKAVTDIFPPHMVGLIGHENTFMLSAIYKKLLWICSEVRRDSPAFFSKQQGDFQSIITGEALSVAVKNATAKQVERWTVPGLMAGNQLCAVSDAGGSMVRRFVLIRFDHRVESSNVNPNLSEDIRNKIGHFILKINSIYLQWASDYGKQDLHPLMSPQIRAFSQSLHSQLDTVARFLEARAESHLVLAYECNADPSMVYMKWTEFTARYKMFLEQNSLPKVALEVDHFMRAFADPQYGLRRVHNTLGYNGEPPKLTWWVMGIGPSDVYGSDD